MEKIRMVVLTRSSKYGKKCVAGINLANGNWVRLVTNDKDSHGAVSDETLTCKNGKRVQVLDIIEAPVFGACSDEIQPENVLLNLQVYIEIVGSMSIEQVLNIHPLETKINILGNEYSYITEERVKNVGYSLTMVEVNNLEIIREENLSGKPKTKAKFYYNGSRYEGMSVTDEKFYSVASGAKFNRAIIVVSIGSPYNNRYYKFVSAIYIR